MYIYILYIYIYIYISGPGCPSGGCSTSGPPKRGGSKPTVCHFPRVPLCKNMISCLGQWCFFQTTYSDVCGTWGNDKGGCSEEGYSESKVFPPIVKHVKQTQLSKLRDPHRFAIPPSVPTPFVPLRSSRHYYYYYYY